MGFYGTNADYYHGKKWMTVYYGVMQITIHITNGCNTLWRSTYDFNLCKYIRKNEEFEDTKGVSKIPKLKDRQHNGQMKKDKQRSTLHYTEN